MALGARQLLAFTFGTASHFEGQLVGALERIEIGSAMRVLDGLFVACESDSAEVSAISLSDLRPSRATTALLDFRLDEEARRAATRRSFGGVAREAVQSLGAVLRPGTAIAAVLVEHKRADTPADVVPDALADAVARAGGSKVVSELVEANGISELTQRLLSAVQDTG